MSMSYNTYVVNILCIATCHVYLYVILYVTILNVCRDYTRPELPSGSEGELGGTANVPDLSAALAGENINTLCQLVCSEGDVSTMFFFTNYSLTLNVNAWLNVQDHHRPSFVL